LRPCGAKSLSVDQNVQYLKSNAGRLEMPSSIVPRPLM